MPADLSMRDFDRPLSANGYRDANHLGMYLNNESINPDAFLSSTALRTRETTEAIINQIKFEEKRVQYLDNLYEPAVREMLKIVNELSSDISTVIMVSHNPAITYFGEYLSGSAVGNMSPASMVVINFAVDNWSEVSQNSGSFEKHITADQV